MDVSFPALLDFHRLTVEGSLPAAASSILILFTQYSGHLPSYAQISISIPIVWCDRKVLFKQLDMDGKVIVMSIVSIVSCAVVISPYHMTSLDLIPAGEDCFNYKCSYWQPS